jgi:septal ring factor EnvC (AmiA/AmiB activator)
MTQKLADRIDSLEQRLRQLKTQHQRSEARQRAFKARRERREDTRRKILVGAIVLAKVEQGVLEESVLKRWLDQALKREDDRALFELPPPCP